MIKGCMTKYGSIYSLFTRGDDPDIIAIDFQAGICFLIDTDSKIPLCYALPNYEISLHELTAVCATKIDYSYLEAIDLSEELLLEVPPEIAN